MSKKIETDVKEEKIVTKYDLKKKRREEERKKEIRNKKITIGVLIVIAAAIVIGAAIGISSYFYTVYKKYIVVDNENISEVEFEYYYGKYKTDTLSQTLYGTMTYGDYFKSYLGYDDTKSDSSQKYSSTNEDYTWYDYFANGSATLIKTDKALLNAAEENGFEYKTETDDYNAFKEDASSQAAAAGLSVSDYYKNMYGSHASESNIESYVKNSLKAKAYSEQVKEDNAATSEEATTYYNDNKMNYDTVTYRTFNVTAVDADMDAAKVIADECVAAATSEEAFAAEGVDYVDENTADNADDPTLVSDTYYSYISNSDVAAWLYDESRKAGDVTAIVDSDAGAYSVVYFVSRAFDTSLIDTTIKDTVTQQKYNDFMQSYEDAVTIDNIKNRIKMLGN